MFVCGKSGLEVVRRWWWVLPVVLVGVSFVGRPGYP